MEKVSTLGERLREIMAQKGLSYDGLGRILDMKAQTINRYVLGQREPKAGVVMEMAAKLEVDERWLQGYDVPPVPVPAREEHLLPVVSNLRPGVRSFPPETVEDRFPAPVREAEDCFYLRVREDSMTNAGIRPGDLVLIRWQSSPRSGQIVACVLDGGPVCLRRYHRQGEFVMLQPENPAYEPRIFPGRGMDQAGAVLIGTAEKLVRDL